MEGVMIVAALVLLILGIICAFKESKTTGLFKAFGVYGRVSAYLCLCLPVGVAATVACIIRGEFASALGALIVAAISAFCWWNIYRKCPDFLKSRLFISILISGLGITFKIAVFFIGAVWTLMSPTEVVGENGEILYIDGTKVYNANGEYVGEASADRKSYIKVTK